MANSIFNYNSERLNEFQLINLNEIVALKMAKRITGKGFVIHTENKKIKKAFETLDKDNDLFSLFFEGEKILSAYGFLIPVWEKSEGGKFFANIGQVYGASQVAKVNYSEELAVVWMRDGSDNNARYLKITFTKKKIIREYYSSMDSVSVMGESDKILKENRLPKEEIHNLGFVPVSFFQNLPKKNLFGGNPAGDWYPDSTPVAGIQKLMDFLFCVITKEAEFNRTRVFADITTTEMNQILQNLSMSLGDNGDYATKLKSLIGDFIVSSNIRPVEGGSGNAIEVIQGDPKFEKYVELFNALKDWYLYGCGLSISDDSEGTKTRLEVQAVNTEEDLTIVTKKTFRQRQWKRFFDKVLIWMGIPADKLNEYSFEFKDSSMKDSLQELENEQFKIDNGLSSKIMSLMKLDSITREEAIQKLQQIEKDNIQFPSQEEQLLEEEQENNDNIPNNEESGEKPPKKSILGKIKDKMFKKDKV